MAGSFRPETYAQDALGAAARRQYNWTDSTFNDVFEGINYDVNDADIEALNLAPGPDKAAIRAQVEGELRGIRGSRGEHDSDWTMLLNPLAGLNLRSRRKARTARRAFQAAVDEEADKRFQAAQLEADQREAEAVKGLIHEREQTAFGSAVRKAGTTMDASLAGGYRGSERAQRRMGLRAADPELQAEISRNRAFERAVARAGVENTTRRGLRDQSIKRAQMAAGLGAMFQQQGQQSLAAGTEMESARNRYNAGFKKGNPLVSALVGAGVGAATGWIPGAVFGGVSGYMQGSGYQ